MSTPSTLLDRHSSIAAAPGGAGGASDGDPSSSGGHHLLVMAPAGFVRHPLPVTGSVVIGRAAEADVRIDDARASRTHLRIHFQGSRFEVEDLASGNGTIVRGETVKAGERTPVLPGEGITIGDTVVMVQRNRARPHRRRVLGHAEFEGRVEWECTRAEAGGGAFAVARLRLEKSTTSARLLELTAAVLRPMDVVGLYGPGEYELLLVGVEEPAARLIESALELTLADAGLAPRLAVARWPAEGRHADALLGRANALLRASTAPKGGTGDPGIESTSGHLVIDEAMRDVWALAERAAAGAINVLVLGETGAGKDVVAYAIHELSSRAARPFVVVNCAALAESLLEGELFGHERGAFTGAAQGRAGLIESAEGGTVFLDEIGEMPFSLQAKLLRVIETKEITRVGSVRPRAMDVRFIAATNRDLEAEALQGGFRRDLYFRLAGMTLTVPALRDRPGAIEKLARLFIERQCLLERRAPPRLSEAALALLEQHSWPGNVRELRNTIERALLLCRGTVIDRQHLPADKLSAAARWVSPVPLRAGRAPAIVPAAAATGSDPEKQRVLDALAAAAGNQSRAARALGISRKVLIARLDAFGIARPRKGEGA